MAQPPAYVPAHSFVADSATLANFPGQALDVEFQDVKATTDAIRTNLALIQRDDGALANSSVGYDQLSAALQTAGLAPAAAWLTATTYVVGTNVLQNGSLYRCLISHISGVFATDLAVAKWLFVVALPVGGGSPGGATGQVQYKIGSTTFGGITGATTDGTTMTLTSPVISAPTGILASDIAFLLGSTGAVSRTVANKLTELVSVGDFGFSTSKTASQNATAFQSACDTGKAVWIPPGSYTCNQVNVTQTNTRIYGSGAALSILSSPQTNAGQIVVSANLGNIDIDGIGFTRSVTATVGASAIVFLGYVDTSKVRRCEIQKQYVGASLNATGYSEFTDNFLHDNLSDHVQQSHTAANGNSQWYVARNLLQGANGRGWFTFSVSGPAGMTLGDYENNRTFGNTGIDWAFVWNGTVPISGVRFNGGTFGSAGNSLIYLDTGGTQHSIQNVTLERAGKDATGANTGSGNFPTAASGIGSGIEITVNNFDVMVDGNKLIANSVAGVNTSASQMTQIINNRIALNATGALIADGTKATYHNNTNNGNTTADRTVTTNSASLQAGGNVPATLNSIVVTVKKQTFSATGTYTPSTGMLYCVIECVGGGGGGGGAAAAAAGTSAAGGGGGAGGYARLYASASTIGASKAVTIGTAGTAGTAGNNAGGNGGDTSVGSLCIGKGGTGGAGGASALGGNGGLGGVAGTGDFTPAGNAGHPGNGNGSIAVSAYGGQGANSMFGGGAQATNPSSQVTTTGNAAVNYGAGGGGGLSWNGGGSAAGGAGTAGYVIITEYCNQ